MYLYNFKQLYFFLDILYLQLIKQLLNNIVINIKIRIHKLLKSIIILCLSVHGVFYRK